MAERIREALRRWLGVDVLDRRLDWHKRQIDMLKERLDEANREIESFRNTLKQRPAPRLVPVMAIDFESRQVQALEKFREEEK